MPTRLLVSLDRTLAQRARANAAAAVRADARNAAERREAVAALLAQPPLGQVRSSDLEPGA